MSSIGLQPYDIFMLAVLAGTVLFGFWKGMAWQLASLASLVLSAVAAFRLGPEAASWIGVEKPWHRFLTMLVVYLLTALAIWLVFRLVAGAIDRVRLKEFDRQIGALFGLAKGVLLCIVITFFAVTLSERARQVVLETRSGRIIAVVVQRATPVLPEEVTSVLGEYIEELDRKLDPSTPPAENTLLDSMRQSPAETETRRLGDAVMDDVQGGLDRGTDRLRREADNQVDRLADEVDRKLESLRKETEHRLAPPR
ncbi:MAG: CvpA family protein [Pirellulales bacterium]|nr:CvpA family protein [Pirellulales bacterium]